MNHKDPTPQEHIAASHHVSHDRAFPEWVPPEVFDQAQRLGEHEALQALGLVGGRCPVRRASAGDHEKPRRSLNAEGSLLLRRCSIRGWRRSLPGNLLSLLDLPSYQRRPLRRLVHGPGKRIPFCFGEPGQFRVIRTRHAHFLSAVRHAADIPVQPTARQNGCDDMFPGTSGDSATERPHARKFQVAMGTACR